MKELLRFAVLLTAVGPIATLYRGFYALVVRLVLRMYKRHAAVRSVYLTRGMAREEFLPAISDLDFAVIARDGNPQVLHSIRREHRQLARATLIVDPELLLFDETSLRREYERNPYFQHRFAEGRREWRLLDGDDLLGALPSLPAEGAFQGQLVEMKVWWARFALRFICRAEGKVSRLARDTLCYKSASEILRMVRALQGDTPACTRAEAIRDALPTLTADDRRFVQGLQQLRAERFLRSRPQLVEETGAFLIRRMLAFCGGLDQHPLGKPVRPVRLSIDFSPEELGIGSALRNHIEAVTELAGRRFDGSLIGAGLVPSVFFPANELLVVLAVDPERVPSCETLAELTHYHRTQEPPSWRRARLFLLVGSMGLQLDLSDLGDSWRSVILPASHPEAFAAFPRAALGPGDSPPLFDGEPRWTPLVEHDREVFWLERPELLADPSLYKINGACLLSMFWRTAQLTATFRSLSEHDARFPLTIPAVCRLLAAQGDPLPVELEPLRQATTDPAHDTDLPRLLPRAIRYLRSLA